jgi:hypothetical protein
VHSFANQVELTDLPIERLALSLSRLPRKSLDVRRLSVLLVVRRNVTGKSKIAANAWVKLTFITGSSQSERMSVSITR